MKFKRKSVLIILSVIISACFIAIILAEKIIQNTAKGKLFSEINKVPYNKVGLLLGTARMLRNGLINPYYHYRIKAAEELLKTGKIKYLVISGDNGHKNYNEPEMMRTDLINSGIDSTRIFLDYAGFRTFDSVVRLKKIFGQDSVTIISQQFHNERALYIAKHESMYAIGFNAKDYTGNRSMKVLIREKFARVKVFIDDLFGIKPKFYGKKIKIPD
jgi:SanA protein